MTNRALPAVPRVLVDADVYPRGWALDAILSMADADFLAPLWSRKVLEEAYRAMVGDQGRDGAAARSLLGYVAGSYPLGECRPDPVVEAGLSLPDPGDRHVLAAALAGGADAIVTYNLRDFPDAALSPLGLRAVGPDELVLALVREDEEQARRVFRDLVSRKRRPPRTMAEEAAGLRRAGLEGVAGWLEGRGGPEGGSGAA